MSSSPSFYSRPVKVIREEETYLGHSGTILYANSTITRFAHKMQSLLLGNPHSINAPATLSSSIISTVRADALRSLGADPAHFDLVFVSNGTYESYAVVEKAANERGIYIRSGGICCPGGVYSALQYEPWHLNRARSAGHHCGSNGLSVINGLPSGVAHIKAHQVICNYYLPFPTLLNTKTHMYTLSIGGSSLRSSPISGAQCPMRKESIHSTAHRTKYPTKVAKSYEPNHKASSSSLVTSSVGPPVLIISQRLS
ncbi:hypothetical protein B0H67DRAFT_679176 [Lasiosphaeris hirsuta]|uniref:Aminotransferase class V domain-containing protein n=1 Tax=Lasiosphaeris hirsuta TaxID=260670 RepID=A0AA40E7X6_9PEZI|nr:hypothetical protein B0H67DRAFT_679176 [Lasiosphaeris hirsuta]